MPAVIAAAPAIAFMLAGGLNLNARTGLASLLVGGLSLIACGLARDAGFKLQPKLWNDWGGSPTVRRLRWADTPNETLQARLHGDIARITGHQLPTPERETNDPRGADEEYNAAIGVLRERASNPEVFRKVFAENMEYGFRRNCLGLRTIALFLAISGAIASIALCVWGTGPAADRLATWGWPGFVSAAAMIFWGWIVTPEWVRKPAETYADRLLESVDTLKNQHPPKGT
jgi:hypothetical protein